MTIFFLKSLLSLALFLLAAAGMYAMFEVFGRPAAAAGVERLKRLHKIIGYVFFVLFVFISYLCVGFLAAAKAEPAPRAVLHIVLALFVLALFALKVLFVRIYRQFYGQAKVLGTVIGIVTFILAGISGGYYLVASGFGKDRTVDRSASYALRGPFLTIVQSELPPTTAIRTDPRSIDRGKALFAAKCAICHDAHSSTHTIIGPGLKGVLKRPELPVSKLPATAGNIRRQLKQPLGRMPSFAYLSSGEVEDLIAYLHTL